MHAFLSDGELMAPRGKSPRRSELGGITILTTLGLLVLLTVMIFSLGKNSLRELTVTGTTWQAAKASEAAEAGLDWFVLWANPDNASSATAFKRDQFLSALQQLNAGGGAWMNNSYHQPAATKDWDRSAVLESQPTETTSDMVFANSGTGFSQSSSTTGNQVVQSFDVFFRYLGTPLVPTVSSGAGSPAGPGSGQTGRALILYQVQATGKASIPIGSAAYMTYRAHRESYVTATP